MSSEQDSRPAFLSDTWPPIRGMSLRDWFAGQILCGLTNGGYVSLDDDNNSHDNRCYNAYLGQIEYVYKLADAVLKERAKYVK